MKQTAVEWLIEKLKSQGLLIGEPNNLVAVREAKEMEKQQQGYSKEEVLKAQQAILGNIKDALQDENYIINYLKQFKNK